MKVFLTGGTGFIGQPLTKTLLDRGWNVTALVRKQEKPSAQAISGMGAKLAAGDVTEHELMRTAMQDADIVIHNAGVYEFGVNKAGEQNMQAVNVTGTDNVLGLAKELRFPGRYMFLLFKLLAKPDASPVTKHSRGKHPAALPMNAQKPRPIKLPAGTELKGCR